jgi:hypothetical protein
MSMPVGHTTTQRRQSTQSPAPFAPFLPRGSPRLVSYPTTSECSSSIADWSLPYGQMTTHICSRNQAKLP